MKIQYRFDFSNEWHDYATVPTSFEARQISKRLKKHIGPCGKVRIISMKDH